MTRILVVLAAVLLVASSAAAPDQKAPRIVSALMQDSDRDARADSVRLTYSTRIRHARDRDGRYPFTVAGYRIRSIGPASGRALVIVLVEKAQPDPQARPAIRYRRTTTQPVLDLARTQAAAQVFRGARNHGNTPPDPEEPPTPTPVSDRDGDGTPDTEDCAPDDRTIHPKAADQPDLDFLDSNCDRIDGTETDAIFASPTGNDTNPGTKNKPKRQIDAALGAAGRKYVLAASGSYSHVTAVTGVSVYGGYDPGDWSRRTDKITSIVGAPEGLLADGATNVTLQQLRIRGDSASGDGGSAYGIRAINGSSLRLQRVTVSAGDGAPGASGAAGAAGRPGEPGGPGTKGACDSNVKAPGGAGGYSPVGRDGGKGGDGKYESRGEDGAMGLVGTPGGKGGPAGNKGLFGRDGWVGSAGVAGVSGSGGSSSTSLASTSWQGLGGREGVYGAPGNGGGGGGAGGGQDGLFVTNGTGNGGGGGGGGGEGGRGGGGGLSGAGSFGVYLHNSSIVVENGSITAGNGGAGGRGGDGGRGGAGGAPSERNFYCIGEIGSGAGGGRGGDGGGGGGGGGGAGGPSIGIFTGGSATAKLNDSKVAFGTAGAGGGAGLGGTPAAPAEAGIAQKFYP